MLSTALVDRCCMQQPMFMPDAPLLFQCTSSKSTQTAWYEGRDESVENCLPSRGTQQLQANGKACSVAKGLHIAFTALPCFHTLR